MFNPSGFDYELLISRLHGGVRAFQSLRAHRRQRSEAPAPAPPEQPTAPPRPPTSQPEPQADPRPIALEPRAFISVGGRMVPVFGEIDGDLFPAPPQPPTAPPASEAPLPTPPRAAPEQPDLPPPPTPPPPPAPSPLKLPPPTPPACLGLLYGQRRPAATDPSSAPSPEQATRPPQPAPPPATPAQEAPSIATLTALLAARADEEAQRLEKLHAEHRACIALLLQQQRDELQARAEAEAARTAQLLRDVLAEHRAELASASHAHADQLAHLLSLQQQPPEPRHDLELRSALLEHARQQRDATDELAEHITAVTTLVADLGQTISMLAVAAAKDSRATAAPPAPLTPPTTPRSTPSADPLNATPSSTSPPDRLTPLQTHSCPASISILPPTATIDTFTGDAGITPERRWSG